MALGGGTWLTQNKKLPGAYINFTSKVRASVNLADRGYGAIPVELDWGPEDKVFTVEAADFQKKSMAIFGYDYSNDKIRVLRDLFKNLQTGYFYRLSNGALKATCDLATAVYGGIRGNNLLICIQPNVDEDGKYDVITYLSEEENGVTVRTALDKQIVSSFDELEDNEYVKFARQGEIADAVTAGMALAGGSNGSAITGLQYQQFIDAVEPYYFNILCCPSTEKTIKDLFIQFTKRMREEVGAKFQVVVHDYEKADYEGCISVKNKVTDKGFAESSLVFWVTGAEASCAVNASCTNKSYDGDFEVYCDYKQTELEKAITDGQLIFHRVTDPVEGDIVGDVNILTDINTFTSFSKSKNEDFSLNQVIRVLDQHAIDIARIFNKQYLGKEGNDGDGRTALWGDIVAYEKEMQRIRAIQNFSPDDVPVPEQGNSKTAVLSGYAIQPTVCMEKLYMDIIVA